MDAPDIPGVPPTVISGSGSQYEDFLTYDDDGDIVITRQRKKKGAPRKEQSSKQAGGSGGTGGGCSPPRYNLPPGLQVPPGDEDQLADCIGRNPLQET